MKALLALLFITSTSFAQVVASEQLINQAHDILEECSQHYHLEPIIDSKIGLPYENMERDDEIRTLFNEQVILARKTKTKLSKDFDDSCHQVVTMFTQGATLGFNKNSRITTNTNKLSKPVRHEIIQLQNECNEFYDIDGIINLVRKEEIEETKAMHFSQKMFLDRGILVAREERRPSKQIEQMCHESLAAYIAGSLQGIDYAFHTNEQLQSALDSVAKASLSKSVEEGTVKPIASVDDTVEKSQYELFLEDIKEMNEKKGNTDAGER